MAEKQDRKDMKIVNDNVFGIIKLPFYITSIIDTPQFQRLRFISQLGLVQFVYPSATHTRFMHSIGVFYLASKLVRKLQRQLKDDKAELQISDKEVKCVEIAALCHDIGHGPMSHFWEILCLEIKKNNADFQYRKHDEIFREFWRFISQNEEVIKSLGEIGIEENEEKLIERLILGKPEYGDQEILFLIISNNESGMDVDKWEYLTRDSIQLGHKTSNLLIEVKRMIHFARAIKDKLDGKWKIAFRSKESRNIIEIYKLRMHLHESAYRHKTIAAIEQMLITGFLSNHFLEERKSFGDSDWIMKHTDSYIYKCLKKYSGEIDEFSRILKRDLYILEIEAIKDHLIDKIEEESKKIQNKCDPNRESYTPVIIQFHNSTNDTNPITKLPFYEKRDIDKIFYYKDTDNVVELNDSYLSLPSVLKGHFIQSKCLIFYLAKTQEHYHKDDLIKYLNDEMWKVQKF